MDEIYRIIKTVRLTVSACKMLDILKKLSGLAAGALCLIFAVRLWGRR